MRDRAGQILRVACLVLAALVLVRLLGAGCHVGALVGVKIPPVPVLETNSVSGTNAMAAAKGTNTPPAKTGATNSSKPAVVGTNAAPDKMTNAVLTNAVAVAVANTNSSPTQMALPVSTNDISLTTNLPAAISATVGTNSVAVGTNLISGTNAVPNGTNVAAAGTNASTGAKPQKKSRNNSSPEMAMADGPESGGGPMMPGMPGKAPKLPPEIQARLDKMVASEIFAPVMHPMPMALLGIAGDTAFLRTASGQTGLVKEGDSLVEVKLLRIGINRVLVESDGQKNELMIFDGYGGESLLTSTNESSKK
jgi:hypothetical protein